MHFPGHNTVRGSQLASEGWYSEGQKQCTLFRGTIRWRWMTRNLLLITNLVYKLKKIVGSDNFSAQFIKIISHYKK